MMRQGLVARVALCGLAGAGGFLLHACGEGAGTTDGGTTRPAASPLQVTAGTATVTNGGSYGIPDNTMGATVPVYSRQRDRVVVRNNSGAPMTVRTVTVTPAEGVLAEEFSLEDTAMVPNPLRVMNATVAAGQSLDFYLKFTPISGGPRAAVVAIDTSLGPVRFTATGVGRPTVLTRTTHLTLDRERVFGAGNADELAGALVGDASGNLYFSANASQLVDGVSDDLLVGRLNADGTLAWARVWNGPNRDRANDSGQNAETGGTARSLALGPDGSLYALASTATTSTNNTFAVLVLKIDGATGNVAWSRAWSPTPTVRTASDSAEGYALDVSGDAVLVAGTTSGNAQALFFSLNRMTGALVAQRSIELVATQNDRAYTVRADGRGGAYLAGLAGSAGFLAHVGAAATASPTLDWVKTVPIAMGSGINDLDVDGAGNVYASLDVRGAQTVVAVASFDMTGARRWVKSFRSDNNDRFNTHVVRVNGSTVYVGGRMGDPNLDRTQGDGVLLALATANGAYQWGNLHFSGTNQDSLCEHRVKGIAFAGNRLALATQAYTGNDNRTRYAGHWYELPVGMENTQDFNVMPATSMGTAAPIAMGAVRDAASLGRWVPAPSSAELRAPFPSRPGASPDADVLVSWFTLR